MSPTGCAAHFQFRFHFLFDTHSYKTIQIHFHPFPRGSAASVLTSNLSKERVRRDRRNVKSAPKDAFRMSAGGRKKRPWMSQTWWGDAAPERPQRELMASDTACLAPIWTPTLPFKPLFFQMYSPQPDTIPTIRSPSPEARRRFCFLFYFIFLQH